MVLSQAQHPLMFLCCLTSRDRTIVYPWKKNNGEKPKISVYVITIQTLNTTLCMFRVKDDEEKLVIPFIPLRGKRSFDTGSAVWVQTLSGKIMLCS